MKCCKVLNLAMLLPTWDDENPYNCLAAVTQACSPDDDLVDTPLPNSDCVWFVDGLASKTFDTGKISLVGVWLCGCK